MTASAGRIEGLSARIDTISAAWENETDSRITLPTLQDGSVLDAMEAVFELSDRAMSRLSTLGAGDDGIGVSQILEELHEVSLDVQLHAMNIQSERLRGASRALAALRTDNGTGELLERTCAEVVRRCGFGRAVLSQVTGTAWKPWIAESTSNDDLSAWFPDWVGTTITIDPHAPEHQLLTAHRAVLVPDTETASVHRPIIVDSGRSRSYVVAPLMSRGTVVGFLHADNQTSGMRVSSIDRDVLWAFASGVGFLSERVALQKTLSQQRHQTREILVEAAESIMAFAEEGAAGDAAHAPLRRDSVSEERAALDELTKRETEVLRLMAEGLTNAAIAERLVVAHDTIKSHVKHILRKLGVSNRSQAVTMCLNG